MPWTPDMLRAFGVSEQGVQQVFSQSAPVPKSGPFPNYTPYSQAGPAMGVPPNAQAVIPRIPPTPVVRPASGLPITDAQYRPIGPQRQIGYTPKYTQSTTAGTSTSGSTYNPYGNKMYQGGRGVTKTPSGGAALPLDNSGGLLGELYRNWSSKSNKYIPIIEQMWGGQPTAEKWRQEADDAYKQARSGLKIHGQDPSGVYKSHGMTTPQAAGFPALRQMPNQAQFEEEFRKSQEMKKSDYGKVPGTGYFQVEGQPRQYLMGDAAKASGGFSRPSTADANLAREEAEYQQSREISARRAALDAQELQQSLAQRAQSAIASGDYKQATALGQMLQQAGGLQVDDYGTQQLAQAQAKAVPQQMSRKLDLEAAQAELARAQAAGIPQGNAIKAATALQQARAQLAESDAKTLDAVLKSGDPNAIVGLAVYPQFKSFVAAYLAAQEAAKG